MAEGESRRGDYDAAEQDFKSAKEGISPERSVDEITGAVAKREAASQRIEEIKNLDEDEAREIYRQYHELFARKEQIDGEVATFRKEKLGMKEPKEEEEKERTRETEIKRNVEKWKVRAKILELDIDGATIEAEVRAAIEAVPEEKAKELGPEVAYDVMFKGVKPSQILRLAKEHSRFYEWDGMDEYFDTQKLPRSNQEKSYAIAYAFQQEPDEDSLGERAKSAEGWKKKGGEFMALPERVLAGASWKEEKGSDLDEKNITLCAGSRAHSGDVSGVSFSSGDREVHVDGCNPGARVPILGVRRVVSSET